MSIKSLKNQSYTNKSYFNSANLTGGGTAAPVITSIIICDSSYNNLDDTALAPGGSYVKLIGTGFKTGCTVYFNNATVTATFVSSTEVRIQTPSTSVGSYNIMLFNPGTDGGAIYLNLSVSNAPTWTTNAGSLGTQYETTAVNTSVAATGDTPITYSLFSGSLPAGTTLSSDGTLSGTAPAESGSTTYSFTLNAKDAQNQDTTRSFSLTINVDVVSWTTPTSNQVISSYEYSPISNVTLLASSAAGYSANNYSANDLPTGITLAGNTISGTANTTGNTYTRLTATANTSGRSATRDVVFNVNQDVVTWSSPADATEYTLSGGTAMSNVTLSAASAAGKTITYTANALPSGLSLSGSTISGTPDTAQTVYTLLTATAATTNRSATRTISWSISLGDAYWKYTTLALNGTTTVTPFNMDSSNTNLSLTVAGDARASNFNPYQPGYYSMYFEGTATGAPISITTSSNQLDLAGDFTVELWFYDMGTSKTLQQFMWSSGGITCGINAYDGNSTRKLDWRAGGSAPIYGVTAITPNTWHHAAFIKSNSTFRIYLDGKLEYYNASYTTTFASTSTTIGSANNGDANYSFLGYISNLRVVKDTVIYPTASTTVGTQVFTPPTAPLTSVANTRMLIGQTNRYNDVSPSNLTLTPSTTTKIQSAHPFSTIYQANTQYYSTNFSSSAYTTTSITGGLGSGDFTIEGWVYLTASFSNNGIFHITPGGYLPSNSLGIAFALYGSGWHIFQNNSGDPSGLAPSPSLNRWYHFAMVKSGSTFKTYIDGVQIYSAADTTDYTSSTYLVIGAYWNSSYPFPGGHISNFRIVRGTALYSGSSTTVANFTVPTEPLTAVANTVFLGLQSDKLVDNSSNNFAITPSAVANIKPLAVSPFTPLGYTSTPITTYGSSYHLNASRDSSQIYTPTSVVYNVGSSDFTLEFWVNFNDTATQQQEIFRFDGATTFNPYLMLWSTNAFYFRTTETTGDIVTAFASGITAGQWVHLCVTRSGNNYTIYRNGISVATGTSTGVVNENKKLILGSGNFKGYLSDVRFTKGSVLYTSNFVPEFTRPLTAVANTQLLTVQTNGAHNNSTFKDESGFNNIITRSGNVTNGTFSPYGDNWSNYFDGSGDYLTVTTSSAQFVPGSSSDFTIEFWMFWQGADSTRIDILDMNGVVLWRDPSNNLYYFYSTTNYIGAANFTLANYGNRWTHFALSRNSGVTKMYLNGVQAGTSYTNTNNINSGTTYYIGYNAGVGASYKGYISDWRMISGTGLYPTAFTPPTAPLTPVANTKLLTCQSSRFLDASPVNHTITKNGDVAVYKFSPYSSATLPKYYSTYFDGTGDFLNTPTSITNLVNFPSGTDYTIECWVYPTAAVVNQEILGSYSGAVSGRWILRTAGDGLTPNLYVYPTGEWTFTAGSGALTLNTWNHIAIVRIGSTTKGYLNGVERMSTSTAMTLDGGSNSLYIGAAYSGRTPWNGYISNVRIVKGLGVYTGNFTVPTSPLATSQEASTNISSVVIANTSLLTCQSNKHIDNSINNFTINATGDVKPLAVSPFTPTANTTAVYSPSTFGGSMYFDGSGDNLSIPDSNSWYFTGDFTIEAWVYPTTINTNNVIVSQWGAGGDASFIFKYLSSSNRLQFNHNTVTVTGSSTALISNQWNHCAVTRSGSTVKLFVNGVQDTTTGTISAGSFQNSSNPLLIGALNGGSEYPTGYITDVRILNGKALYTSNFYPPTTPLTPVVYSNNSTAIANTAYATFFLNGTSGGIIDQTRTVDLETLGDVKLAPESPFESGYYSNYFNGSSRLSISAGLVNWNADFCIEFWINTTAGSNPVSVGSYWNGVFGSGSFSIWVDNGAVQMLHANSSGTNQGPFIQTSSGLVNDGKWHHVAITQVQGSPKIFRMFVDGILRGYKSETAWSDIGNTGYNISFDSATYTRYFTGSLSNYRITSNIPAAYSTSSSTTDTTVFTPSTTALTAVSGTNLLTCQSNRLLDNSTNARTITLTGSVTVKSYNPFQRNTGQSYYFDGTGDYLTVNGINTPLTLGTGDYTIEFWVYFNTVSGTQCLFDGRPSGTSSTSGYINIAAVSGAINCYNNGASPFITGPTAVAGQWYHYALSRVSGTTTLYINGVRYGAATADSGNYTFGANRPIIGNDGNSVGTAQLNGYIKDLRITKGIGRYTSNNQVNLTSTFEVK